ncbi:hypothetical protein K3495_g10453 [Podosphaera aphanis]|nr:hypothetical protein K3495_g10453 [Podosphaera aphanis]
MGTARGGVKMLKSTSPIIVAIKAWGDSLPPGLLSSMNITLDQLLVIAPKRWIVYVPMVLLPSGSFGGDWSFVLPSDTTFRHLDCRTAHLWELILRNIAGREGKGKLTHLAVNSSIPLESSCGGHEKTKNILRTPSGLIPLYGDFGPALSPDLEPSQEDFTDAFWVRTKQNGITQIWAPRYTMFSRGNIKEKARLLEFHNDEHTNKDDLRNSSAVDLYAGIGYFVFSYVKMGLGRVLGWELNPWSVEGLRRGAVANGWSIKIVNPREELVIEDEKIMVFLEDNKMAGERISQLQTEINVIHVNCGLLPTSSASWEMALQVLGEGWLHLHDNVGINDVSTRRIEIERRFRHWLKSSYGEVNVTHVELVKTFAPGIWHCVFDLKVNRDGRIT